MGLDNKRPLVGVGVAVLRDGKILLGKRKGSHGAGDWSFPGGHLEFGESVEQCAIRELAEETGLRVRSMRLGPWTNDLFDENKHYITIFVFADQVEGEPQLLEPHKCDGWHWFDCNELPKPLFRTIESLLKKVGPEGLIPRPSDE